MRTTCGRAACGALVVLLLGIGAGESRAQAAFALTEARSVRSDAMGRASVAVVWGVPDAAGNPASLASFDGASWEMGRTEYTTFLPTRIRVTHGRLLVGHRGIGGEIGGLPGNPQERGWVEFGPSIEVERDRVSSLHLAASIPSLLGGHAVRSGASWDAAIGVGMKHVRTEWMDGSSVDDSWKRDVLDLGLLARWSPLRAVPGDDARWRCDVGAGAAALNQALGTSSGSSFNEIESHLGASLHGAWLGPERRAQTGVARWLDGRPNWIGVGVAFDHENLGSRVTEHVGAELSLADVLYFRGGRLRDPRGSYANTSGWGVALPIGPWGALRWDHAWVPADDAVSAGHLLYDGGAVECDVWRVWHDVARHRAAKATAQ